MYTRFIKLTSCKIKINITIKNILMLLHKFRSICIIFENTCDNKKKKL